MKIIIKLLIKFYKYIISPLLPCACRFTPTCSEYALDAFNKYGIFKATFLTIKRFIRCNPFFKSRFDPVP